jgi:hypothetical protein
MTHFGAKSLQAVRKECTNGAGDERAVQLRLDDHRAQTVGLLGSTIGLRI